MLETRLEALRALLREHNAAIGGSGRPGYVDPEAFQNNLLAYGATTEAHLSRLSYEDIASLLPAANGVRPLMLAKDIAKVFRGREEVAVTSERAETMSVRELVEAYDPRLAGPVAKRLLELSHGQPCVVFVEGRVDVATTHKLLDELMQGFEPRKFIDVGGQTRDIYAVGQPPEALADENPVFHTRPLRPDGTCDQTGRSWAGVPLDVRQLVYLAVQSHELDASFQRAHDIIDMAIAGGAFEKLRLRCPKAAAVYGRGELPRLKVSLNSKPAGGPLGHAQKVQWKR